MSRRWDDCRNGDKQGQRARDSYGNGHESDRDEKVKTCDATDHIWRNEPLQQAIMNVRYRRGDQPARWFGPLALLVRSVPHGG